MTQIIRFRSKLKPKVSQEQQAWLKMELQAMRELNEKTNVHEFSGSEAKPTGSTGTN